MTDILHVWITFLHKKKLTFSSFNIIFLLSTKPKWHVSGRLKESCWRSFWLSNKEIIQRSFHSDGVWLRSITDIKFNGSFPHTFCVAPASGRSWSCVLSQTKLTTLFCSPDHFLLENISQWHDWLKLPVTMQGICNCCYHFGMHLLYSRSYCSVTCQYYDWISWHNALEIKYWNTVPHPTWNLAV